MANSQVTSDRYRYASIDTAPGADGYWSQSVSMSQVKAGPIWFSRSGGGTATVHLQYKAPWYDGWVDYETDVDLSVDGTRCILEDMGAGVKWRAGVK